MIVHDPEQFTGHKKPENFSLSRESIYMSDYSIKIRFDYNNNKKLLTLVEKSRGHCNEDKAFEIIKDIIDIIYDGEYSDVLKVGAFIELKKSIQEISEKYRIGEFL